MSQRCGTKLMRNIFQMTKLKTNSHEYHGYNRVSVTSVCWECMSILEEVICEVPWHPHRRAHLSIPRDRKVIQDQLILTMSVYNLPIRLPQWFKFPIHVLWSIKDLPSSEFPITARCLSVCPPKRFIILEYTLNRASFFEYVSAPNSVTQIMHKSCSLLTLALSLAAHSFLHFFYIYSDEGKVVVLKAKNVTLHYSLGSLTARASRSCEGGRLPGHHTLAMMGNPGFLPRQVPT